MNITSNAGIPTGNSQYVPPKNWKDLSVEEKIERTREQIKQLSFVIGRHSNQLQELINEFRNHGHLEGKVVKDVKTSIGGLATGDRIANPEAEKNGEVYF